MFTGLVAAIGEVIDVTPMKGDARFLIAPSPAFENLVVGESIAVDGACLTVESYDNRAFQAFASAETLGVTTLSGLRRGSRVNLERALAFGDRLGGHLVSGHVDAVAEVEAIEDQGRSRKIRIRFPEEFSAQVIQKGSVALDGISLTINRCGTGFLEVNVIPETQAATTVGRWARGRKVNFETDLIGKYVQRMLRPDAERPESGATSGVTLDFLRDNGF